MVYENYIRWCYSEIDGIRDSLSEEESEILEASYGSKSEEEIVQLTYQHAKEVADYVQKTPAQRLKLKTYREPLEKVRIAYLSMLYLQSSAQMLELTDSYLDPGISYRLMASNSILVREKLLFPNIDLFPYRQRPNAEMLEQMKKWGM